jgi:two-component system cell cycle sensor histidine kinase/response regulator CckA
MISLSPTPPRWLASVVTWVGLAAFATAVQIPFPIGFGSQWLLAAPFVIPFLAGLLGGVRGVVGAAVGTAAVHVVAGTSALPFAAAMSAVALEGGVAVFLARSGRPFDPGFLFPRDVVRFAAVVAAVAAARALVGFGGSLARGGDGVTTALSAGSHSWFTVILAAPAFLILTRGGRWPRPSAARVAEAAAVTVLILGVNYRFFGSGGTVLDAVPLPFLSLLAVLTCWVAFRFESAGMAALVLASLLEIVALSAVRGTWRPFFPEGTSAAAQAAVLLALGSVVLMNLFVAALAGARRRQDEEQRLLVAALREKAQKLADMNALLAAQTARAESQSKTLLAQNGAIEDVNRKLARQQAWVDAVIESMPVGVYLIDREEYDLSRAPSPAPDEGVGRRGPVVPMNHLANSLVVMRADGTPVPHDEWPIVRVMRSGVPIFGENLRVRATDGAEKTLSVNAAPIRDPDGSVTGAVAVTVDVTERERDAERARVTDERLRFALASARTIAWEREANGGMIRRTGSVADWLGLPIDTGFDNLDTYAAHVHPDDRAEAERYFYSTTTRPGEFDFQYRMLRADGGVVWVATRGEVIPDESGRPVRIAGVHIDVTEQKVTEQKLRLLESAVVYARDAVVLFDATETPNAGRSVLYVNNAFCAMSGYAREEVVGRSLSVLRGPDSSAATLDELRAALDAGQPLRTEILNYRKNGTAYWADLTLELVRDAAGRKSHWVMIQRDVTDRKRAEDALRRSEEMFRGIFENAWAGVSLTDASGRFVSANPAFLAMLGMGEADLLGRHSRELTHPDSWALQAPIVEEVLAGTRDRYQIKKQYTRADGTTFWGELFCNAIRGPGGEFLYGLGVTVDVTERTRLEEQVRASEARLRALYENSAAGVIVVDPDSVIVEVNPAFARMLGYEPAEMVGLAVRALTHPDDVPAERAALDDLMAGVRDDVRVRKRYRRRDGTFVVADLYTQAVRDTWGYVVFRVGVAIDVTERLALEDQLRQSQKMEALGQMAGGIAHDFNNLLTAVIGNLSLVRRDGADPDRPLLDAAEQAASRAADLTRKLLGYARRSQLVLGPVRLADVANEVVAILRRTLDPRIVIRADVGECADVVGDATLLNQVLFNLCLNSRDALSEGGNITVSLAPVRADAPPAGLPAGAYARLSVADDGAGMAAETRAKIFEPFFTTKGVGKGTGLGLAMVLGIVQQHGGWVDCETSPGAGTRFDVYLPCAQADALGPRRGLSRPVVYPDDTPVETELPPGGETILLVDDEPLVRGLARAVLETGGYRVVEAEDGVEAVEWYRDHPREAVLVIMDLTMPRLSGRDAFRQIRAMDPRAKILFSSGYSAEELTDVDGAVGMLAKPYRPAELLKTVRKAIVRSMPAEDGQELTHLAE